MNTKMRDFIMNTTRRDFLKSLTLGTAALTTGSMGLPSVGRAQQKAPDKSKVAFVASKDHYDATYQSILPFQQEVANAIGNKQVVIKVNAGMARPEFFDNSTHVGQLQAILDFLSPIHDRQIIIAEGTASASCDQFIGYESYGYLPLAEHYNVNFVDANLTPYTQKYIYAANHRPQPINIINLFFDPDVYLISAARLKTHNAIVATLSLKNVAMGSPLNRWNVESVNRRQRNEKSMMHGGSGSSGGRELSFNLFTLASQGVRPDLGVVDAVESIAGDGPWDGALKLDHGVAVASTDFVAADRVGIELMGIDPKYMKYLEWCGQAGFGNYDLANIEVDGPDYRNYIREYQLHSNVQNQIQWIDDGEGV